ncbi:hypothetical protein [Blastococcus sp. LR1]|uniref:hypothetical protein n=1 Tax=Blastococcus sp. LR1 TaxID=2877000 RepID=UPI001CCC4124|nr:hypothetical protein [Blastococcus sp. LR1]MCA0143764.1 hypothetical protein [Blastococcus sp. LR1]
MEQWEHLMVKVISKTSEGHPEVSTVGPDGELRLVDNQNGTINRTMGLLAELGAEGWQMISTESFDKVRLFWMKRPKPQDRGGWAVTA